MRRALPMTAALLCVSASPGQAQDVRRLSGTWVHRVITTSVSKVPVVGKIVNESRYYAVVRMDHESSRVKLAIEPCWVRIIGSVKRVHTIVPDAAVAVMGPHYRSARLDGDELSIAWAVDVLGARLEDEWSDPLPTSTDDASVWDEDGDGMPGVTIHIMGPVDGDVYVAQRTWNTLKGEVDESGDVIRGSVTWVTEQQILDASTMWLRSNPGSKPHTDKSRNRFEIRRMPAATTCAEVKNRNDALFGK